MSSDGDNGGINGGADRAAPGASTADAGTIRAPSRDGNNTGWAGGSAGGGNTPNVAGAQEVVLSTSGGLGEAETSGRDSERHSARRQQQLQRPGQLLRLERRDAGQQLHAGAEGRGPREPPELKSVYDINPMGGGRIIRDKLWFYLTYRQTGGGAHGPGHVVQQERGQPECLDGRFRSEPAGVQRQPGPERDRAHHVADHAAQQVLHALVGAVHDQLHQGRRRRDDDAGSERPDALPAVADSVGELFGAGHEPGPAGGRLGRLPGAVPQPAAAAGRQPQRPR